MRFLHTILLGVLFTCFAGGCAMQRSALVVPEDEAALTVILVRHAERVDGSADSALSDAGHDRAAELARVLSSVAFNGIHSSDYARTRSTAAPVVRATGCAMALYDARDLEALAERLRLGSGCHLVVGHSNTTPAMVTLLGGDAGEPIDDATEFDRMYVLTFLPSGVVETRVLRYGD